MFPANILDVPAVTAAAIMREPKAIPTLGSEERIPANIAMVRPTVKVPAFIPDSGA